MAGLAREFVLWTLGAFAISVAQQGRESLREVGAELRERHSLPAIAAAAVKGDSIVDAAVIGVRVVGEPDVAALGDRFHIASCTKSFTSMLVAMLVEEGRLAWSTTLGEALPQLRGKVLEGYLRVRLDQLLSHTGGIPPYTNFGQNRLEELASLQGTPQEQRARFLVEVLNEPIAASAGEQELYSNSGYAAASVLVEQAAGKPWEDLVRERIFVPLQMGSAGFGWPASSSNKSQPRGHLMNEATGALQPQPLDDPYRLPQCLWPAGAISCSIEDLARYAQEHLLGLQGRGKLLRKETYEKLHATWNGQSTGFTLGWGRGLDPEFGVIHFGAGSGGTFFARIWICPTLNLAIVTMTNSGSGGDATKTAIDRLARIYR